MIEMAFLSPSPLELMMIAVIALIVLGPSRLPEAARSIGKGMREMRNSFQSAGQDDDYAAEPAERLSADTEPEDDEEGEHPAPADEDDRGAGETAGRV